MQNEQTYKSKMGLRGRVEILLFGPDGKIKDKRNIKDARYIENTITTYGDKVVADQMSDQGESAISHMAIGTGTGGGASNNSLENETDRNAITSNTQQSGADDNDIIVVGDWAAGDGTGAITEAGIFNAASGPGCLAYSSFSAINKGASDTLQINWTITFGAS